MRKGIILYRSKYGATKKYAEWLSESTGFPCIQTQKADIREVCKYDTVILAGAIYASGISGLAFLKKNSAALAGKRLAIFCVGASPFNQDALDQIVTHNLSNMLTGVPCFYGRGAWNEANMSFTDRSMCRLLQKAVAKQDPESYEPWQKALMCAAGEVCDWTDKTYLTPLLHWLRVETTE